MKPHQTEYLFEPGVLSAEATTNGAEPSPTGEEAAAPDLRRTIFERRCGGGGAAADRPVVSVVAGHTAKGIYKQSAGNRTWWKGVVMVDIARVPELKQVTLRCSQPV